MTDRGFWFGRPGAGLNVRRLMYQSLIWRLVARDDAGRLSPAFNAEDLEGLAYALVYGVRRNVDLGRNFLRVQVLINEEETVELALAEPSDAFRH